MPPVTVADPVPVPVPRLGMKKTAGTEKFAFTLSVAEKVKVNVPVMELAELRLRISVIRADPLKVTGPSGLTVPDPLKVKLKAPPLAGVAVPFPVKESATAVVAARDC